MPTGPDASPEHVILDENVKAQEHGFYVIGAFRVRTLFSFFLPFSTCLQQCFYLNVFHSLLDIIFFQVSPDNKLVAYAEDTKGDETYTVYVIDAESQAPVGKPLVGVTSDVEWAGDNALVYTTRDEILRPDKVSILRLNCVVLLFA